MLRCDGQQVDDNKPYAELWMGTHPSAPSKIKQQDGSTVTLQQYIGAELPYLFKILSIRTALSIQAHPDLKLAERLHRENPKEYKDANHKPEMATAITKFEAMCGFRPIKQVQHYLSTVPELAAVVGSDVTQTINQASDEASSKSALKAIFSAVMKSPESSFKPQLDTLIKRIQSSQPRDETWSSDSLDVYQLIPRLAEQYPGDIGIFCPFILNSFSADAGASFFLQANEPHAYISGDIVECMACSDNVVRAGLTPKFRDVENLTEMLTYKPVTIEALKPQQLSSHVQLMTPPIPEFALYSAHLPVGSKDTLPSSKSHGILLVLKGKGKMQEKSGEAREIKGGQVWFVPSGVHIDLASDANDELVAFKCTANDVEKQNMSRL